MALISCLALARNVDSIHWLLTGGYRAKLFLDHVDNLSNMLRRTAPEGDAESIILEIGVSVRSIKFAENWIQSPAAEIGI